MASLISLPAYQAPRNALLNLSPINDAIDSNRRNALMQGQLDLQQQAGARADEQLGMQRETHGVQMKAARTAAARQEAQMAAGQVQAVMQLPEGQRQAAWQRLVTTDPNFSKLPDELKDFSVGPRVIMAKAHEYESEGVRAERQAKLGLMGAQTQNALAEAKARGQKSVLDEAIAGVVRGALPQAGGEPPQGQPPAQGGGNPSGQSPASPGLRPQSFNGGGPGGTPRNALLQPAADTGRYADPNLIQAQAVTAPQAQPELPDLVDTPMGRMPRARARQLGFALALGGKGDAGKMLGDAAAVGMPGKEARNAIEKKLFAATEQRSRLNAIRSRFRPEWQTLDEQVKQYGYSWLDAIGPMRDKIPPQERQRMAEYTAYRQDAYENINAYIKEITGAQMSEAEATRLAKAAPDPAKDSPTQFEAKLENGLEKADLAIARYNYLLRRGFDGKPWESGVSLERMRGIINQRGAQIEKTIRSANPDAPDDAVQRETFRAVKTEFGI